MSNTDLLDDDIYHPEKVKRILNDVGLSRHYEMDTGNIIVEESDGIKVIIRHDYRGLQILQKFPTVGNGPQVFVSISIFVLSLFLLIPFPFSLLVAVLGGQLFSYLWFKPKIKALKNRVEAAIYQYYNEE